jgi:hypothetical protein
VPFIIKTNNTIIEVQDHAEATTWGVSTDADVPHFAGVAPSTFHVFCDMLTENNWMIPIFPTKDWAEAYIADPVRAQKLRLFE